MVFSDTTNKNGIIQRFEGLTGLGDAAVSGNATLLKIVTGLVNESYDKIVNAILRVDENWNWDDYNYSGADKFPRGVQTLTSGTNYYTLPVAVSSANAATLLKVVKVAFLDSDSKERELIPTNLPEAQLNTIYSTSGMPIYYRLIGNSVKMWPAPDNGVSVTLTNGLIIYFQRSYDAFTSSDTTQQPGFPGTFHYLIPMDAASVYLLPSDQKLSVSYAQLFREGIEQLQAHYSGQNKDISTVIRTRYRNPR